jgi:hypothetical protein
MLEHLWDWILEIERERSGRGSEWDGEIPVAATCLLFQYGLQNGMSEATQAVICWNAKVRQHLALHGTEAGLRKLDLCLESFEKLEGLATVERLKDCSQREMERSVRESLLLPFQVSRYFRNSDSDSDSDSGYFLVSKFDSDSDSGYLGSRLSTPTPIPTLAISGVDLDSDSDLGVPTLNSTPTPTLALFWLFSESSFDSDCDSESDCDRDPDFDSDSGVILAIFGVVFRL